MTCYIINIALLSLFDNNAIEIMKEEEKRNIVVVVGCET